MYLQRNPPLNIPYGYISINIYPIDNARFIFYFRMQDWSPSLFTLSHYMLTTSLLEGTDLWIRVLDVWQHLGHSPWSLSADTWQHIRCAWTPYPPRDPTPSLKVALSNLESGLWIQKAAFYHPENKWRTASENGVGINNARPQAWIDNFALYQYNP